MERASLVGSDETLVDSKGNGFFFLGLLYRKNFTHGCYNVEATNFLDASEIVN